MTARRADLSPFAPIFGGQEIPAQFADQFLLHPDDGYHVVLEGSMERVWHRPSWIAPGLWLISNFDMLFPEMGNDVPVHVEIRAFVRGAYVVHVWDRAFTFAHKRRFVAELRYEARQQRVVERFGPRGSLELEWETQFDGQGTLSIIASRWHLRIGRLRARLPGFIFGTVFANQVADLETTDQISMNLKVVSPLLGDFFGYEGRFKIRRVPTQ